MNILFLSIGRVNSIEEKGLYTDLLREFRDKGHNVYAVSKIEKKLNETTRFYTEKGVHFLKVKTGNFSEVGNFKKGISTITLEERFIRAIKKYLRDVKFDLILYSTPPITFERVVKYVKNRDNAKTYLLLKDIFPQNAVDLKMMSKKSVLYKYFSKKEKKLYEISDFIGCMSPKNVEYIVNHNPEIASNKVEVCPNSIEVFDILNKNENKFTIREKYNLPNNKVICIYGGNIGKPQGIDYIIDCLEDNRTNEDVFFLIVGGGTEYEKLQSYLQAKQNKNVLLYPHIPKEDYNSLVRTCDIGLIFLDHRFTIPNFPSRILPYMHAAMPILAATDSSTDVGDIIEQGNFGLWCESNDVKAFTKNLNKLNDIDLRKKMGRNAYEYLNNSYTSRHSYEIIMEHFIN